MKFATPWINEFLREDQRISIGLTGKNNRNKSRSGVSRSPERALALPRGDLRQSACAGRGHRIVKAGLPGTRPGKGLMEAKFCGKLPEGQPSTFAGQAAGQFADITPPAWVKAAPCSMFGEARPACGRY
jgi:hypothetical protein